METTSAPGKGLEPATMAFLEKINSAGGPPIYKMPVHHARDVLLQLQKSVDLPVMPAYMEDMVIPGGPDGQVPVRIVRPEGSTGMLPVVMYIHGGGWVLGDKDTHDRLIREISNRTKAAVVFVEYSRSPEARYPAAIEECYHATEYIANNGKGLNIDSSKLAIAGDSVGGNMATIVSLMASQRGGPKIGYQVLFYPVTNASFDTASYRQFADGYWLSREAMKWFWDLYLPDEKERMQPTASPIQASVDKLAKLPPALVITGEFDVLRDEGEAYAHKLMEAGVRVTAVRCLGTIHDFVMLNALANTPATRSAMDLACSMLSGALGA